MKKTHRTRLCTRCNEWFITTTKTGKVCDNCNLNNSRWSKQKSATTNRDGLPKWYILRNNKIYDTCRSLSFAREYCSKLSTAHPLDEWQIVPILK